MKCRRHFAECHIANCRVRQIPNVSFREVVDQFDVKNLLVQKSGDTKCLEAKCRIVSVRALEESEPIISIEIS